MATVGTMEHLLAFSENNTRYAQLYGVLSSLEDFDLTSFLDNCFATEQACEVH